MESGKRKSENRKKAAIFVFFCCFAMFAAVGSFYSPTSDDFYFMTFKYASFSTIFHNALYYGNGRLLGNLGAILICNSVFLNAIAKGVVLSGIAVLLPLLLNVQTGFGYILSALLFAGISPSVFAQVYSWTSGFQNYAPPIFLLIICLLLIKYNPKNKVLSAVSYFGVAVFGFCSQLYVEHNTVINIIIAAVTVFLCFFVSKKDRAKSVVWFVFTACGAAVMFMIPKLFKDTTTFMEDDYRKVEIINADSFVNNFVNNLWYGLNLTAGSIILLLTLGVLSCLLLRRAKKESKRPKFISFVIAVDVILSAMLLMYSFFFSSSESLLECSVRDGIKFLPSIGILFIFIFALFLLKNSSLKWCSLICVGLGFVSVSPFAVVSPFGSRGVFFFMFFLIVAALLAYSEASKSVDERTIKIAEKCGAAAVLACVFCISVVSFDIYTYSKIRDSYIAQKMSEKAQTIELFEIPSEYFLNSKWEFRRYNYYNEIDDIKFEFVNWDTWKENRKKEGLDYNKWENLLGVDDLNLRR